MSADVDQRELYFSKLEEFLSLSLDGKLNGAALAKRELELDELKKSLEERLSQHEKELKARGSELESGFERLRQELELAAKERSRALERSYETRVRALEQEHLALITEAREKEIFLKSEEKSLAERQARFREYYDEQRAELQAQLKSFREEIESQVRLRCELSDRLLEQRHESLESGWRRERELLLRELESWKAKAQELAPRAIELDKQLAAAQEAARQARAASDAKTLVYEEQRRGFEALRNVWEEERRLLKEELARWRDDYGQQAKDR